ncbi:carotenoid oxygenase family protein [Phormidium tenue FACHB-886]|nr:carotenoid oxygenase family protein [Phormidium tenue FACHB-886]
MTALSSHTRHSRTYQRAWAKALSKPAREFGSTPLPVLSGAVPAGLRGTLYRNGPGRLERGGSPVGHWFDGDGAILAVHFTDDGATGVYRYVKTAGYVAESAANEFLYGNYGTKPPLPIWQYWLNLLTHTETLKNTANTSVLALPDKLLALWEAGNPHALDLQTLDTLGVDSLGALEAQQPYSAHPRQDPLTGEIFNIGIDPQSQMHLYRSDRYGTIQNKGKIKLDDIALLHSFALAGRYLIFFIPPMRLNLLPLLFGYKSYSEAIEWQPQQATQILVVDRETFEVVSRGEAEPWFQWHFGNGSVEPDGTVVLDFVRFADFDHTNEWLRQVATGQAHTLSVGTLCQVRLNPQTGKIIELQPVVDRPCEFPVVSPQQVGQPWRHTYLALHRAEEVDVAQELFGAIARFDYETETLTEADFGKNRYPTEPIYVADPANPDRGWVLAVVYDGNTNQSEVWIFDSDRLNEEPLCRLGLPEVIPMGFHGIWRSA